MVRHCELVQVNSGSGLDHTTGMFTAPTDGSYYFQFHGLVTNFLFSRLCLPISPNIVLLSITLSQVGPGHEARVQLELNSSPVLHIYDRWPECGRARPHTWDFLDCLYAGTTARAGPWRTGSPCLVRVSSYRWRSASAPSPADISPTTPTAPQTGDKFRVVLVKGCLGVEGGQYLSFLGHRLGPALP